MPRVSRQKAAEHHAVIEDVSARLFRERGLNGVSVAEVMASAGLTHGGFYGHFESKDALAAAACSHAFAQSTRRWEERCKGQDDPQCWLTEVIDSYLSVFQRDHAGTSCPAAAFAGDVARESADKPIRQAFVDGVKGLAAALQKMDPAIAGSDRPGDEARALTRLSLLVGASVLARATRGDPVSEQILDAARRDLVGEAAGPGATDASKVPKAPKALRAPRAPRAPNTAARRSTR